MAKEKTTALPEAKEQQFTLPFDPSDPRIQNIYSNWVLPVIGGSDISLLFGFQYDGPNGTIITEPSVRIVCTHSNFVAWVEFLQTRAEFFKQIYDGKPTSVFEIDPSKVSEAFKELSPTGEMNDDTPTTS